MLIYKLKDSDLITKIFNVSDDTHSMLTRKVITPCEYCTENGGEESCGDCESGCQTTCESSCQTSCETGCQENCEYYCQTTCQLACQSCDTCQNACQNTCQTTCEISCQDTCESACQSCDTCQTTCQLACQDTCESACQTTCQLACQVCDTNQSKCVKQGQNITGHIGTFDSKVSKKEIVKSSCYTSLINYINKALTICGYTDSQLNESANIQHIFLDDSLFDKIRQYVNKIADTNIDGFQQRSIITSTKMNTIQVYLNNSKIPDTIPCCENSGYESCISRQL